MAPTLNPLPAQRADRAWRRTPEGKAYTDRANKRRRATPVYAWYHRWYNRWQGQARRYRLAGLVVPAPRVVLGAVVLGDGAEHYVTPEERALYASGAYLTQLPPTTAPRRQGRRLTPLQVAYVKIELAQAGVAPRDGTQKRLAAELGCSLGAINRIALGLRHPDPLHLTRLLEHVPLALPDDAPTTKEVA